MYIPELSRLVVGMTPAAQAFKPLGCLVAVCIATAVSNASPVWPGEGVRLEARQGAKIEAKDATVFVQTEKCSPNTWPNVAFAYPTPTDLSSVRAIRATFTNCSDRTLRVSIKVKGETVQGRLPDGGCNVPAHGCRTFSLPLFSEKWIFDSDPHLLGLKRNPYVGNGSSYSLTKVESIVVYIHAQDDVRFGVSGVELVEDGSAIAPPTVLKAEGFFPWVDEFGQARFAEWPDKVHSREELRTRAEAESRELAAQPTGIPDADRFGGWAKGPQLKATGRFRTEKVNGKWWLVDPDGHLFFSHGVNSAWECAPTGVTGREKYFEKLPPREGSAKQFWSYFEKPVFRNYYGDPAHAPFWAFSFTSHNLWLKFGDDWQLKNAETAQRRMLSWGFNTLNGGFPGMSRLPRRLPFVIGIGTKSRPIAGANGYWGKLKDPFAPEFEVSCREAVKKALSWGGTNEWCVGWTFDNEQSWGPDGTALARSVLASPDDQPAKAALLEILAKKGLTAADATGETLRELGEAVAEKYYSTVRAAIKAAAPDVLYLGDRNDKRNPEVFRAAARNCDVVTLNVYDYYPSVELPGDAEDKPFMVTEFHFGCYDTGYFYASLLPVQSQRRRAECYASYVRAAIDNPNCVGTHWFCWRDCPITGQLGEGANAQCGLVSTSDVPYSEMVKAIRFVSHGMYARRFSTLSSSCNHEKGGHL